MLAGRGALGRGASGCCGCSTDSNVTGCPACCEGRRQGASIISGREDCAHCCFRLPTGRQLGCRVTATTTRDGCGGAGEAVRTDARQAIGSGAAESRTPRCGPKVRSAGMKSRSVIGGRTRSEGKVPERRGAGCDGSPLSNPSSCRVPWTMRGSTLPPASGDARGGGDLPDPSVRRIRSPVPAGVVSPH